MFHKFNAMKSDLKEKFQNLKLLALDFDGIFTDGSVYVDQNGVESVRCSRKDGMGVELLKKHGIEVIIIHVCLYAQKK